MALISEAVKKAFTGEDKEDSFDGDCRTEQDDEFVDEISKIVRKKIESELSCIPLRQKNKKVLPVNSEIVETKEKSFKEKVAEAEKQYQEFIKENIDAREFSVRM